MASPGTRGLLTFPLGRDASDRLMVLGSVSPGGLDRLTRVWHWRWRFGRASFWTLRGAARTCVSKAKAWSIRRRVGAIAVRCRRERADARSSRDN